MKYIIKKDAAIIPHKRHWRFCVGSGRAHLALRADYTKQLKFIHDSLGIMYVRFHGIFDDDMRTYNDLSMQIPVAGAEEFSEYNFNACGVAYDNVLDAGMKPFVELSFMPAKLRSKDTKGVFFYQPNIGPPKDDKAWADYIKAFVRFLEKRYGAEEIRTWYFEVWNEPDLVLPFFAGTRDEYFHLYEVTARAIKEVDEKLRVGGPATSGSRWIKSFLAFCRENKVPVDFVTTHQYAGDPLGGVEDQGESDSDKRTKVSSGYVGMEALKIRTQPYVDSLKTIEDKTFLNGFRALMPDKSEIKDIPNDVFIKNSAIVRKQAGEIPVFYTEWNISASFSAYTNDTRKVAAYDVKTALDVADNVDGSAIWGFSDIFEEFHPFPQEFHGGYGMLSQNGIPKPLFYALQMLKDAGDDRIDLGKDATLGEIGIAAFKKGEEKQILLFRQKMKNLDFPKEKTEILIEMSKEPEKVLVRRIDEEHGNPLRMWEKMGSPVSLSKKDIENIKEKTKVLEEEWPFIYENGMVKVSVELAVNDVYFMRILGQ